MFTPSTLIASAARLHVADSAGASEDADMLVRAGRSLDAIAQRWNRMKWKFLQAEQYIALSAPFNVTGCAVTAGATTLTTLSASGFASVLVDDLAVGGGLRGETYILSGTGAASTALGLNVAASSTESGFTVNFRRPIYALASDFKGLYNASLTSNVRPLFYVQRRTLDREVYDKTSAGTVAAYDLYHSGSSGKIRFFMAPNGAETVLLRYQRRMTMPTFASASALDLPQDYEDVFLAGARAHFLADKNEQGTRLAFWDRHYREGLAQMRADEANLADELLTFEPPSVAYRDRTEQHDSLTAWWVS